MLLQYMVIYLSGPYGNICDQTDIYVTRPD